MRKTPTIWTKNKVNDMMRQENRVIRMISDTDDRLLSNVFYYWKCSVCDNIWESTLSTVLRSKNITGCPSCIRKLSNDILDSRLIGRDIKRLGDYIKSSIKINFQCLISQCGFIWAASPNSILSIKSGCPKCAGLVKLSNEEIDTRLQNRNIKRLGNYINTDTPIEFQCLEEDCKNIWKASPANIINKYRGCPLHFRKNEKICVDLLRQYFTIDHNYHLYNIDNSISKSCSVDIFIKANTPEYNGIAIEYQGRQHYVPVNWGKISYKLALSNFNKQQISDTKKRQFCRDYKIKYISIDGRKYFGDKLRKYLNDVVLPMINNIIFNKNVSSFSG